MSFKEVIETSQAVAILKKLQIDESHLWHKYCRIYSKKFSEPLSQVLYMDPETVLTEVFADQLDDLDLTDPDQLQNVSDMVNSLLDPDFDAKKERALREEYQKLEEEEKLRLKEGRAIHKSLEKEKFKFVKDEPRKELPKVGGLNDKLIKQLQNSKNEI